MFQETAGIAQEGKFTGYRVGCGNAMFKNQLPCRDKINLIFGTVCFIWPVL